MTDINNVTLVGRLTKDADIRYTAGGTAVLNFSIAVNESRKQGERWIEEASFFDVTLFGKMGESVHKYMTKGKQVAISGRLQQQKWQKDGQNYSKVAVIANYVQLFVGARDGGRSPAESAQASESDIPF
ncbi:single-stranded DNA-binding protein [Treponema lecithinolyticum]